jgi:precorrin-4 methylase
MAALDAAGLSYEIVPGVSSLFGAAAALGVELTLPTVCQSVIISRMAGRTPVPERESLRALAGHGATMAIFLSAALIDEVVAELIAGGCPPETPAAVVYRATWPDEQIVRTCLAELALAMRAAGITRQALVLVGEALRRRQADGESRASLLYDPAFGHGRRRPRGERQS